ncbi:MAG: hypothetical protein H0X25_19710 [Acidobacteriales bacterium]|nr:hypothetical protein [Terriglobales bacterium]
MYNVPENPGSTYVFSGARDSTKSKPLATVNPNTQSGRSKRSREYNSAVSPGLSSIGRDGERFIIKKLFCLILISPGGSSDLDTLSETQLIAGMTYLSLFPGIVLNQVSGAKGFADLTVH